MWKWNPSNIVDCQQCARGRDSTDKKGDVTDRIKASIDTFGDNPKLYGSIITTAIAVLSLLVSMVLKKAEELVIKTYQERHQDKSKLFILIQQSKHYVYKTIRLIRRLIKITINCFLPFVDVII